MAKEMESRRRTIDINLDHATGQELDPADLLAAILAQNAGPAVPAFGPEWASQFRPPAIPGTVQEKYVRAGLPVRGVAFFLLWITWDWKRGAFVALALALITLIFVTR
jgi:hypothetical protein